MCKSVFVTGLFGIFFGTWFAVSGHSISSDEARDFLNHYGYMTTPVYAYSRSGASSSNTRGHGLQDSIRLFQSRYGLEVTGLLDEATSRLMKGKRCGNKDIQISTRRRKRHGPAGRPWPNTNLRYTVTQYPNDGDLHSAVVNRELERAFSVWSDVTPLTFTRVPYSPYADILISFSSGIHGDGYPFEGPGGELAHAFLPVYQHHGLNGDIHFDDDETWTYYVDYGSNFFMVAVHEIGHSLGLGHSTVKDAVMYPYYPGYIRDYRLHSDDIRGIRHLYAPPENEGWIADGSHEYLFEDGDLRLGYFDAQRYCQARDASLLSMSGLSEYRFVKNNAESLDFTWLGLRTTEGCNSCKDNNKYKDNSFVCFFTSDRCDRKERECSHCRRAWTWEDGSMLSWTNWEQRRPDHAQKKCVRFVDKGFWRNVSCSDLLKVICKRPILKIME